METVAGTGSSTGLRTLRSVRFRLEAQRPSRLSAQILQVAAGRHRQSRHVLLQLPFPNPQVRRQFRADAVARREPPVTVPLRSVTPALLRLNTTISENEFLGKYFAFSTLKGGFSALPKGN